MATGVSPLMNTTPADLPPLAVVFGSSVAMQELQSKIAKVASSSVPVLIDGESGTGKDIVARLIHQLSPCSTRAFVKVNCPAIPGTLLESELFGYERGGFTGANGQKPGRVEFAHRGTLFLDEISEMDANLQSKLLQFLQDGQFCRIGGREERRVDVRVVCATNRMLEEEIEAGNFRRDLYYRINVVPIHMPPLRERACDIPMLLQYYLNFYNDKYNCQTKPLSAEAMTRLQRYHWPGNIRELENLVRRYVIIASEDALSLEPQRSAHLAIDGIATDGSVPLKKATRQAVRVLERQILLSVLQANRWNRRRAAEILKISYRALLYKMKYAGLPAKRPYMSRPLEPSFND